MTGQIIDWTDEKVAYLRSLEKRGFTMAAIAGMMNARFKTTEFNRNIVIGKIQRAIKGKHTGRAETVKRRERAPIIVEERAEERKVIETRRAEPARKAAEAELQQARGRVSRADEKPPTIITGNLDVTHIDEEYIKMVRDRDPTEFRKQFLQEFPPPAPGPKSFNDLHDGMCKWPLEGQRDLYCAEATGSPRERYCRKHQKASRSAPRAPAGPDDRRHYRARRGKTWGSI